jgi:clan AA aspartic protease
MIRGVVTAYRAVNVPLRLRGPTGIEIELSAAIDTGFTGSLTVPSSTVSALGLVKQSVGVARLADGSIRQFDQFPVEVDWSGQWRTVLVSGVGGTVLLGMELLAGHQLRIEAVPGGAVEITPLP